MTKNNRHNQIDFIEFPANSVEALSRSKAFYQSVFGWSYKDWGDDYADTQDSGIGTGINADFTHRPTSPLAVIYSDSLDVAKSKVLAAQGRITKEIFSFPGGRRFHFKDPAGNELAVWSDK